MKTPNVCFIDTETLGLDPDRHPVWEVGLILPDGTEHEWQVELSPDDINVADPVSLETCRFHERYQPQTVIPVNEHLDRVTTLIPQGCHIAGACPSFDEERLRRPLMRLSRSWPWYYHLIDVEVLAATFILGEWVTINELGVGNPAADGPTDAEMLAARTLPWDSEAISRAVGVDPDDYDRHTALGDAQWARDMYIAVMGEEE